MRKLCLIGVCFVYVGWNLWPLLLYKIDCFEFIFVVCFWGLCLDESSGSRTNSSVRRAFYVYEVVTGSKVVTGSNNLISNNQKGVRNGR